MREDSQNSQILAHLKSGLSISPYQALVKFGSFRLSARIHFLRSKGYNIKSEIVEKDGKTFARYSLNKQS